MTAQRSREPVDLAELDGRPALLLGGVVQSVLLTDGDAEPEGYWPWLLPEQAPRRVLLLGLGGGTVVPLLRRRFPRQPIAITAVEDDPAVLQLARARFKLQTDGLAILQSDAGAAVRALRERGEQFDLVIVDLFRAGGVPPFVCRYRFLDRIAAILGEGGLLTINLNRGTRRTAQLHGLARCFVPVHAVGVGMNLVVHARPRKLTPNASRQGRAIPPR